MDKGQGKINKDKKQWKKKEKGTRERGKGNLSWTDKRFSLDRDEIYVTQGQMEVDKHKAEKPHVKQDEVFNRIKQF